MRCQHSVSKYRAEYSNGVLFRDYMKCEACGAEYSIVEGKWYGVRSETPSRKVGAVKHPETVGPPISALQDRPNAVPHPTAPDHD